MILAAIAMAALVILIGAPLTGWPALVRLDAVLVPALALSAASLRPWRWTDSQWQAIEAWTPSPRVVVCGAVALGAALFWFVLTRFESGSINAVDFTVYFDRPCFQTVHGRPLFVETGSFPPYSQRSLLAVHAYWALLPLCSVYALIASPFWLLAVSVIAVVAGAVHVLRIMRHVGAGGVLAVSTALVFALNDNTARTLNYGFHPEVLYAWFVPWLLDAGLRGKRLQFAAAAIACVLVKEDAFMPLFAAAVVLAFHDFRGMNRADVLLFLVFPVALALTNLAIYFRYVVPAFAPDGPMYANFWANYGPTVLTAAAGMITQPGSVVSRTLSSGFFPSVMAPHLFLPLLGWRWTIGLAPIVLLYGASANPQLRAFGIYYSIVLVPFLVIGASIGAMTAARFLGSSGRRLELAAAAVLVIGTLLIGFGYSLRPWRTVNPAVSDSLELLSGEPFVLVQSELYPHAGYDSRVQMLTPETLLSARYEEAAILLAPTIGAYLVDSDDLNRLRQLPPIRPMPQELLAVRRPPAP
jgi:uncharacterized membrane protein